MGCNVCVVKRPEEQYRIMVQQKGLTNSLRPMDRHGKVRGRRPGRLPLDRPQNSQESLQRTGSVHKMQRGTGILACGGNGTGGGSVAMVAIPDCVDNATQTDISFRNMLTLEKIRGHQHRHGGGGGPFSPPPPLPHFLGPFGVNEFCVTEHNDPDGYSDVHEVDPQDDLQYEEVALYKPSQQEKLGLTVCCRTNDEDDLGIYVGEVNPNSIAAKNGRIREGDRILQINGVDVQSRDEAVAILTREDSVNLSLLLARPDAENENSVDPGDTTLPLHGGGFHPNPRRASCSITSSRLSGYSRLRQGGGGEDTEEEEDEEDGGRGEKEDPPPLPPLLSLAPLLFHSQELDSGVGRTDDSTRYEESSEHDLLGDQSSASNANTPGSTRKVRPGPGPGPGHTTPPFHLQDVQLSSESLPSLDWAAGGGTGRSAYSPPHQRHHKHHHHQPPLRMMMMPGLTEEECQRYRELLGIKCQYERFTEKHKGAAAINDADRHETEANDQEAENGEDWAALSSSLVDVNCNATLSEHELALIEEELRHLEFKCRNILRAQKMQQLRERCLKAWMMEETADAGPDNDNISGNDPEELSAINELPERERPDAGDAGDAAGGSCRSVPLVNAEQIPPPNSSPPPRGQRRDRDGEKRHSNLSFSFSPGFYRKYEIANSKLGSGSSSTPCTPSKFRSLTTEAGHSSKRGVPDGGRSSRAGGATNWPCGGSAESSPHLTRRCRSKPLGRYQSCVTLPSEGLVDPLDGTGAEDEERGRGAGSSGPASPRSVSSAPCGLEDHHTGPSLTSSPPPMEWKVKVRSDGTRYVAKRPVRDRLLKARALKIREERSGTTTDDDAASEMKQGRYWSKEERKQQLLRAREYRRRRELMMQSRLDYLRGDGDALLSTGATDSPESSQTSQLHPDQDPPPKNNPILSQKKITKKRNRRILDNWVTIQELLARGSRSPDGKRIYNHLLSVTTV
ncbi:PDZ domain-containing protein 4-like [Brachionichthys hirsutus]|uniref:PDZ domain-containing protein 4-like n=1 Tax=Brachionichthys hirsutus TaxID=412623 RepID=UPI00360473E7